MEPPADMSKMNPHPRILLTHTPDMRRNYYGERSGPEPFVQRR